VTRPTLTTEDFEQAAAAALDRLKLDMENIPLDVKLSLIEDVATDLADQLEFYGLASLSTDSEEEL